MGISQLVTTENQILVSTILAISKQDAILQTAINALNELAHLDTIEFEDFGKPFGVSNELAGELLSLKAKLVAAKYGRF
jgi:hypothetical protein